MKRRAGELDFSTVSSNGCFGGLSAPPYIGGEGGHAYAPPPTDPTTQPKRRSEMNEEQAERIADALKRTANALESIAGWFTGEGWPNDAVNHIQEPLEAVAKVLATKGDE